MLDSEFEKWHSKQMKREDALKKVEEKVKKLEKISLEVPLHSHFIF